MDWAPSINSYPMAGGMKYGLGPQKNDLWRPLSPRTLDRTGVSEMVLSPFVRKAWYPSSGALIELFNNVHVSVVSPLTMMIAVQLSDACTSSSLPRDTLLLNFIS